MVPTDGGAQRTKSPFLTPARNLAHVAWSNTSTEPASFCFESRTPIHRSVNLAAWMQFPLYPLQELVRHEVDGKPGRYSPESATDLADLIPRVPTATIGE